MKKKQKIGISFKITSGYLLLILCLAISVIVLNSQITNLQQERNSIIKYDSNMRTLSNTLERQIINMESSLHRFLITEDQKYLEKYYEENETWESKYEELETVVRSYSNDQEKLLDIHSSILAWINTVGNPLNKAIEDQDMVRINQMFDGEKSSDAIKSLQEKFTAFRNYETTMIQENIAVLNQKNTNLTFGLFASLALLATITILIFSFISRKISGSINEVTQAIYDISTDERSTNNKLTVKTNDEVSDLVHATNALLSSMEQRQWYQSNLATIITAYQGVDSLPQLGKILLEHLTKSTNSVYGAFYVQNQHNSMKYDKVASFAESEEDVGRQSVEVGKGFIGQGIQEKRILTYENELSNAHYLETALGNIPITHGVIVPVFFGNEIVAVIELASLKKYSNHQLSLVKEVIVYLGVTINSIQGRMEIIRLLNESQAMTEELQVQSEELQTQSEELKMQTEELTTINERLADRTKEAELKSEELEKAQVQLKQTAAELRQSSNYKSEFLANMSHELRTPLNSILILSEMLAENAENRLSKDELEYANVIHNSGQDLLNLINDILDLSKVEAGKMDLWFSETDIYAIPQHIQNLFAPVAQKKNLALHVEVADDIEPVFHTDVKRFYQIINNLLSNALKFTEHGGVDVAITKPQLTKEMQQISDTWITMTVTDSGIGIPIEKQSIVFESFKQADGATVRKYGGSGLGLSICREVSKLLGGWITLDSEENKGSTFTIYLPSLKEGLTPLEEPTSPPEETELIIEEPIVEEIKSADGQASIFKDKHILIVDDDNRNIYSLRHALEQKGVQVVEASNGMECLNILQSNIHIDAVLMDIMMPEMDGYETMEHIRGILQLNELPIIALTAKAMQQDRDRAFKAGASDYISKPLNLEQLFSLLTVWLTNKEQTVNG